jgi:hypothetical protein
MHPRLLFLPSCEVINNQHCITKKSWKPNPICVFPSFRPAIDFHTFIKIQSLTAALFMIPSPVLSIDLA